MTHGKIAITVLSVKNNLIEYSQSVFGESPYSVTYASLTLDSVIGLKRSQPVVVVIDNGSADSKNLCELVATVKQQWPLARRIITGFENMTTLLPIINTVGIHHCQPSGLFPDDILPLLDVQVERYYRSQVHVRRSRELDAQYVRLQTVSAQLKKTRLSLGRLQAQKETSEQSLQTSIKNCTEVIGQLSVAHLPGLSIHQKSMAKTCSDISTVFELDEPAHLTLDLIVQIRFVGQALNPQTISNDDPHGYLQAEHSLSQNEHLSVAASVLNLSRECWDGSGPLGLKGTEIPVLANVVRLWLSYSEACSEHENIDAVIHALEHTCQGNVDPSLTLKLTNYLSSKNTLNDTVFVVSHHNLRPGMVVMEPVFDDDKLLLLASGTLLTQSLIDALESYDWFHHASHEIPVMQSPNSVW